MTAKDLHLAFKIELDKSSNEISYAAQPSFIPIEIDYWLNKAVIQTINNKLTGNNTLKQPFEGSVKRIADLQKLIKTDKDVTLSIPATTPDEIKNWFKINNTVHLVDFINSASASGTFERMFYVESILYVYKSDGENIGKYNVKLVNEELLKNFIKTNYNSPYMTEPVCVVRNNSVDIALSYEMCSSEYKYRIDLTYIKCPEKIDNTVTTELTDFPEHVYSEIASTAALLALENIESKRAELKHQLNNTLE